MKYISDQQKVIIGELKDDVSTLRSEIENLRRQEESGSVELLSLTGGSGHGNERTDPNLENVLSDFVAVHQERRKVQDGGEGCYDDMVDGHKIFLDNAYSEFKHGTKNRTSAMRVEELMHQIVQSNHDIETLISELLKSDREKAINDHRNILCNDINSDFNDVRARLDYELTIRERAVSELREYARGDQVEQFDLLIQEIHELRLSLRERWTELQTELEELTIQITEHRERLRIIITQINEVRITIIEEEHHNDIKSNLLRNRDEYIERLKIAIGDASAPVIKKKEEPKAKFMAAPGDDVDMLLAEALQQYDCDVPLTRLGGGFYLFGTRKIYAKINRGKLIVRVGGGYMAIDEFLRTYSDKELILINKMLNKEAVGAYEELKVYLKYKSENPDAFKCIDPNRRTYVKSPASKIQAHERGRF